MFEIPPLKKTGDLIQALPATFLSFPNSELSGQAGVSTTSYQPVAIRWQVVVPLVWRR